MSEQASRDEFDLGTPRGVMTYGVTTFAGVVLAMVSGWQILEAIAAIANDTVFVRGLNYTWEFDVTTWGWIHLVIGLIGLGTAIGILMGQTWGLIVGIMIAGLSTLSNFMFMPYYPFWSMTIIAIDVLIIWALCRQIADKRV